MSESEKRAAFSGYDTPRSIRSTEVLSEERKAFSGYDTPRSRTENISLQTAEDATSSMTTSVCESVLSPIPDNESKADGKISDDMNQGFEESQAIEESKTDSEYFLMTARETNDDTLKEDTVYHSINDEMLDRPSEDDVDVACLDKPSEQITWEEKTLYSRTVQSLVLASCPPPLPSSPRPSKKNPVRIFDESNPQQEDLSKRQIFIQELPMNILSKDISVSKFEKELLSTDDTFEEIKIDRTHMEATVTVKNMRVAKDLKERVESGEKFFLQDKEVFLSPHNRTPSDPKKFFILGLADSTTDDEICKYVEKSYGIRPSSVIKGDDPEIALLCFDNLEGLTEIQSQVEKQLLEVQKWVLTPVERTRRVRARGFATGTTKETMTNYFEKFSEGGVTPSTVYREDKNDFIISFLTVEDAENVVKKEIRTLNGEQLDICLHYPCLDGDEVFFIKIPCPIELHNLNRHMCRFLQFSTKYRRNLEEKISSHYGRLLWPDENSENSLCIQCSVDEKDKLGGVKVTDWENNSAAVVSDTCRLLSVQYRYFALEIMASLRDEIKRIGVFDPESTGVSFEENRVVIAGEIKNVDELSDKIKRIISSMEQDLDNHELSITKVVKLKRHEFELFEESRYHEQVKTVEVSREKQNVVLKGRKEMVDDAVLKVKDVIQYFPKQTIEEISTLESNLLRSEETTKYVKERMTESGVTGVWTFSKDGTVSVYSKTSEELKTAVKVLTSSLKRTLLKVDQKVGIYMQYGKGKKYLEELEQKYGGKLLFKATKNELYIVSVDCLLKEIKEKVMKFLDLHSDITEVLHLDPGIFRYILSYKRNAIDNILKEYNSMSVSIDIIDKQTRKGFMISGQKESCKLAIIDLQVVVGSVLRNDHIARWPLFDQFLRSSEGINELNKIELAEKCVIRISTDDSKTIPEDSRRESVLAECRIGNCEIKVVEGDITEKEADFIVNPTDSMLDHKRGLGRTLVDKGGFSIQIDCNEYIQRGPYLKDGDIYSGTAGSLPFRGIIHVVVPTWTGGCNDEKSGLSQAVKKCLIEADGHKSASIAFPPIGAGKFGYPNETIAEIMIKTVKTYLRENGAETFLRQVYICDIDMDIPHFLIKEMEKGVGRTSVRLKESEIYTHRKTSLEDSNENGGCFKRIKTEVVTGSITSQDTDVIVNSTNSDLELHVGAISRALVKEGGDQITSELKAKYPNGIIPGETAETTGGKLKCKALFHGVLVKWDGGEGYAEMVLKCFVLNCLYTAHKRHYVSIALPILGTGALQFPSDCVAEVMLNAVKTFEKQVPVSTLKTVRIILNSADEKILKEFEDFRSECDRNEEPTKLSDISSRQSCRVESVFTESTGTDYTTTIGEVILNIEQGDLTSAKTAVIVNSVPENLNIASGSVSRAILRAAGESIQSEANENRKTFRSSGLVMTSSGQLLCQKIIHVRARNSAKGWKEAMVKCLTEVEKSRFNSVSFPALGTGGKGFSAPEMAKTMVSTIRDYILGKDYQHYLKNVRIVVYETEMVKLFTKAVKDALRSSERKSLIRKISHLRKQEDGTKSSGMIFHIYTDSASGATKVIERIEGLRKEVRILVPTKLSESQVSSIKELGEKFTTYVRVSSGGVTLSGYWEIVETVKEKIEKEISSTSSEC